jgi:hypothetical protein
MLAYSSALLSWLACRFRSRVELERQNLLPLLSGLVLALRRLGDDPGAAGAGGGGLRVRSGCGRRWRRTLRGRDHYHGAAAGLAAAGDGLDLGGVRLPRALETQHIAVTGKSGAGKSNLIRGVLRQIEARQEVGVVLDPDREYLHAVRRPSGNPRRSGFSGRTHHALLWPLAGHIP